MNDEELIRFLAEARERCSYEMRAEGEDGTRAGEEKNPKYPYRLKQASEMSGVPTDTFRNWTRMGFLKSSKKRIGRKRTIYVYSGAEVEIARRMYGYVVVGFAPRKARDAVEYSGDISESVIDLPFVRITEHGHFRETKLSDGTIVIGPYPREGPVQYTDTYKGLRRFDGFALISEEGEPFWKVNYGGEISAASGIGREDAVSIYTNVLMPALRQFPRDMPWKRGPDSFEAGEYLYSNNCRGNIRMHNNEEKIIHKPTNEHVYFYSDKGARLR